MPQQWMPAMNSTPELLGGQKRIFSDLILKVGPGNGTDESNYFKFTARGSSWLSGCDLRV